MGVLRAAHRIYRAIETHTPLRGPLHRYRGRLFGYLPPNYTFASVIGAAILALPGTFRIFRLLRLSRVLFRRASAGVPSVPEDVSSTLSIDVDTKAAEATTLNELMAPGFRRAAFEIYRNALYAGMVNAMQEVVQDSASALAMNISEMPVAQMLREFSQSSPAGEEYERLLRLAIELDPAMAEPRYMLGRHLMVLGREDEALHHFRIAASGDIIVKRAQYDLPVNAKAYFEIGSYHLRKGAAQKAVPFLERAIELCPNQTFPSASVALGEALLKSGRYLEGAERCLAGLRYVTSLPTLPPFADTLTR